MSLNVWCFTGRLGRDAETRYLPAGTQVLEFSVAVDVGYGDKKNTIWTKCTLFGERGGRLAQYLTKGTQVAVSGEVNLREWQDRDGGNRSTLEVRVDRVELIGSKRDSEPASYAPAPQPAQRPAARQAAQFDDGDDIPF